MSRRRAQERRQKLGAGPAPTPVTDDPVEALVARARRLRARGDARHALSLLRQACALDDWRPRTFTLLGVQLAREGHHDEAARALEQARWLRARAGDRARATATERLAARLLP
jgi:tetratricopeptide (TPR) repeat protein